MTEIKSNKNYLIGHIYNLTSDISTFRVSLRYRRKIVDQLIELIDDLENKITDNPENKREIREQNQVYNSELKKLNKKQVDNNDEIEKLEKLLKDKGHLCEMAQEELEEAEDYDIPEKIV